MYISQINDKIKTDIHEVQIGRSNLGNIQRKGGVLASLQGFPCLFDQIAPSLRLSMKRYTQAMMIPMTTNIGMMLMMVLSVVFMAGICS